MGLKTSLFWCAVVLTLGAVWLILDLPTDQEIQQIVTDWIGTYGLPLVFVGSFIEALLFVGIYFPGSLIIFLGVGLAPTPAHAVLAVLCITAGMFLGYNTNYAMGKYGWYRVFMKLGMRASLEKAEFKMKQNDTRYILYTYWHPGLAAFTSTAAGILKTRYRRFAFLSFGALFIWNTIWGVVVYQIGESALRIMDFKVIISVFASWILFELGLFFYRKYRSTSQQHESSVDPSDQL